MNDDRHIAAVTAQFPFVSLFSAEVTGPVSYTHLTLPTILRV